ncbi:toll/interleukin-1 receptor domain-containing protein [Priestia megaterium]|uniref:toll/interleukin-1 receptor domain-containing protein n=1 Tax=Priestia megaterium TaxID=1404 RepID=UPI002D80DD7A|nr:toll/interleukin-1 receptor domain-containing protein [Priestia megaterium]MEB4870173.1 toll/interleukin-1 receptor domain-containing protein [Priestia megaterium]
MDSLCKPYLFLLDYSDRESEKEFILNLIKNFKEEFNKIMLFINNNPYNLELFLYILFDQNDDDFREWLNVYYSNKQLIPNAPTNIWELAQIKGYDCVAYRDNEDFFLTEALFNGNVFEDVFEFYDKKIYNNNWKSGLISDDFIIFLCYSSEDKQYVDETFDILQKKQIRVWYDKYEISPGDSVWDQINEGLGRSNLGILFISKSTFHKNLTVGENERKYLIRKHTVCILLDIEIKDLPPLLQTADHYINFSDPHAIIQLVQIIKSYEN